MFEAQNLIKTGCLYRVGDGQNLFIKDVPWLPDAVDPYVHSVSKALINQKVVSLMVTGERLWDEDVVRDLFDERDMNLIFSIPLRRN